MGQDNLLDVKRFTSFLSKRVVLTLMIILGLFISNELIFWWARHYGVSENEIYDIAILQEDLTYGSGKSIESITAMDFDTEDNLWIAQDDGVTVLRTDGTSKTYGNRMGGVDSLAVDSSDQVWIWSRSGLQKLRQNGMWTNEAILAFFGEDEGILAADDEGQLWVVTEGQLSWFSNGEWTNIATDFSRLSSSAKSIQVDQQGNVWIADMFYIGYFSQAGQWENSVFRLDMIRAISVDQNGGVWARTSDGLSLCKENNCSA